jgi:hypothetical protein
MEKLVRGDGGGGPEDGLDVAWGRDQVDLGPGREVPADDVLGRPGKVVSAGVSVAHGHGDGEMRGVGAYLERPRNLLMFVMKWYLLVTYGMAEGSLGTPFLSSGERESAEIEKRTNGMVVQTATYGRSASHSRARVEVVILQPWSDVDTWEVDLVVNREEGITSKCALRK